MKKLFLLTLFALGLSVTPSYGQGTVPSDYNGPSANDIAGAVLSGLFGGGGEIPVRDGVTRAETTITAVKTTAMLIDMLIQALTGGGPGNEATGILIQRQAEYGQDGSILYGQYSPGLWMDTYKEDIVYKHGDWKEDETLRNHRRLTTPMDAMMLLKMRQDAFGNDLQRADDIKASIDGCEGRNCAIRASGAASSEDIYQHLQTQQLLMTVATLLANQVGGEVNDMTQKAAQQSYVVTNGGVSPQLAEWTDRGLW